MDFNLIKGGSSFMATGVLQGSGLLNNNSIFNLMNQNSTVNFGNAPNSNPFYEVLNVEKKESKSLYKNLYNNKAKANQKKEETSNNSIFKQ